MLFKSLLKAQLKTKIKLLLYIFFRVPPPDFKATKWQLGLMVKLSETNSLQPPFNQENVKYQLLTVATDPLTMPKFECHAHMVEESVKEVAKAVIK